MSIYVNGHVAGFYSSHGSEATFKAGQDEFWKDIIKTKTNWHYAFAMWGHEYLRPPVKIVPNNTNIYQMFGSCTNLKIIESAYFDLSQVKSATAEASQGFTYTFYNCTSLEEIQDLGIGSIYPLFTLASTFYGCRQLKTIKKITVAETTKYSNAFYVCNNLQNIEFAGTIGQNGLNLQWSKNLTHDSLMSIINALADKSGDTSSTTWTVTIGESNKAKLTAEEITLAESKGWNLA